MDPARVLLDRLLVEAAVRAEEARAAERAAYEAWRRASEERAEASEAEAIAAARAGYSRQYPDHVLAEVASRARSGPALPSDGGR